MTRVARSTIVVARVSGVNTHAIMKSIGMDGLWTKGTLTEEEAKGWDRIVRETARKGRAGVEGKDIQTIETTYVSKDI